MPGGFIKPLNPRSGGEIAKLWPRLDVARVESDWAEYQVRVQSPPAKPKAIREELEKIVQLSGELRVTLETLPEEAQDHLWDCLWETKRHDLPRQMSGDLTIIRHAAMRGYNAELGRDGRRMRGAKHRLFYSLRKTLEGGGYGGDRIKGHIARLAEILFDDAAFEKPKDMARAVREAFEGGDDRLAGAG